MSENLPTTNDILDSRENIHELNVKVVTNPDRRKFAVGNTGLRFNILENDGSPYLEQHFEPDGYASPAKNKEEQLKRITLYAGALWEFIEETDGDDIPDVVKGVTNPTMDEARKKLLGDHYSSTAVSDSMNGKELRKYKFDLQAVRADEQLMQKLEKYNKRMKNQEYMMNQPPQTYSNRRLNIE